MPLASTSRRRWSKAAEQALAVAKPVEGDALGRRHARQLGAVGRERGVGQAEIAGVAVVAPGRVARLRREADERRDRRVDRALELREDRAEAGPAALRACCWRRE